MDFDNGLTPFIDDLYTHRYEWDGTQPEEILHSTMYDSDGKQYRPESKWRKIHFQVLYTLVDHFGYLGLTSNYTRRRFDELDQFFDETGFRERLTTSLDISAATEIYDLLLDDVMLNYWNCIKK